MVTKMFIVCVFIFLLVIIGGCSWKLWNHYPHDNFLEEMVEGMIKEKTTLDIDLTPSSPEVH